MTPLLLLHRARQVADTEFARHEAPVTPSQYAVLAAIEELGEPSQAQIVRATGVDRSTMADIVLRLIRDGLVRRVRSQKDARAYHVSLTAKGRVAIAAGATAVAATEREILKRVPPALRAHFLQALSFVARGESSTAKLEAAE